MAPWWMMGLLGALILASAPTSIAVSSNICDVHIEDVTATSKIILPISQESYPTTHTFKDDSTFMIEATSTQPLEKRLSIPTSGLAESSCILDPNSIDDQFNILGSNFIPLVRQDNDGLQPLPAPTSEAQANEMGPPDDYALPVFFFQKSDNAPTGVYDIVLSGPTLQYVAMTSDGNTVLTTSSTGATPMRQNGQELVTGIFGVDCRGRITVTHGGSPYTWDISTDGTSTAFATGLTASNRTMIAYSLKRQTASRMKLRDRNNYTEGAAPRCPSSPLIWWQGSSRALEASIPTAAGHPTALTSCRTSVLGAAAMSTITAMTIALAAHSNHVT